MLWPFPKVLISSYVTFLFFENVIPSLECVMSPLSHSSPTLFLISSHSLDDLILYFRGNRSYQMGIISYIYYQFCNLSYVFTDFLFPFTDFLFPFCDCGGSFLQTKEGLFICSLDSIILKDFTASIISSLSCILNESLSAGGFPLIFRHIQFPPVKTTKALSGSFPFLALPLHCYLSFTSQSTQQYSSC